MKLPITLLLVSTLCACNKIANDAAETSAEQSQEPSSETQGTEGLKLDLSLASAVGVEGKGQGLRLLEGEGELEAGPMMAVDSDGAVKDAFGIEDQGARPKVLMTETRGDSVVLVFRTPEQLPNPGYVDPGDKQVSDGDRTAHKTWPCVLATAPIASGEVKCLDNEIEGLGEYEWSVQVGADESIYYYGAIGLNTGKGDWKIKKLTKAGAIETVYEGKVDEFKVLGDGSVLTRSLETLKLDGKMIGQGKILGAIGSDVYFEPAGAKMMLADSDLPIKVVSKSKFSTTTFDEGIPLRIVEIGGKGYAVYNYFADVTNKEAGSVTMLKQIYPEQAAPVILDASYLEVIQAGSKVFAKGTGKVVELDLTTGRTTEVVAVDAIAMSASAKNLIISAENKMVIVNLETMQVTEKDTEVTLTQVEAISK